MIEIEGMVQGHWPPCAQLPGGEDRGERLRPVTRPPRSLLLMAELHPGWWSWHGLPPTFHYDLAGWSRTAARWPAAPSLAPDLGVHGLPREVVVCEKSGARTEGSGKKRHIGAVLRERLLCYAMSLGSPATSGLR